MFGFADDIEEEAGHLGQRGFLHCCVRML